MNATLHQQNMLISSTKPPGLARKRAGRGLAATGVRVPNQTITPPLA
jgi:hypothetical protein